MNLTLYLEKVPTNDHFVRGLNEKLLDVVAYSDKGKGKIIGRWPWYYSNKPTKQNKTVMLNCYRWNIEWL
jgi:hypothetical protein